MADLQNVTVDEHGHPRHFQIQRDRLASDGDTPQQAAMKFIQEQAAALKLPSNATSALDMRSALAPTAETESLHLESEKQLMGSTIVSYSQTLFGLPIYQAGIAVVMHAPDNSIISATSTLHYDIDAKAPTAAQADLTAASNGGLDTLVRKALPAGQDVRINGTKLIVYRYDFSKRSNAHPDDQGERGFGAEPPTLKLPPVPASITEGRHYVVVEALFTLALPDWGDLNWQAFIEVETGAVLFLRALVDGVTGLVFDRDPITKTGNVANLPNATAATLDALRDSVTLTDLGLPVGGQQNLSGTFVRVAEVTLPTVPAPAEATPFNFNYSSRTNNFAAVNAYFHCDRFFRLVRDLGFNIPSYFDGTAFPVPIDHRGKGTVADQGNIRNADCRGNATNTGIGSVNFALADLGDVVHPIGIAADWRVVLHELGGHGILWDHVNSPNFGFAHSAGDSVAVIVNDPDSHAPDRFESFPWVVINRRHDRPVNGWGFGGLNDVGGYSTEQILSTTHFRVYRSIGGDSLHQANRVFASRAAVYLILRAVGQLTPATNPPTPLAWEQQLETADAGTWTSTNPAETNSGGAYHKVIRWAYEKQGLFRGPGAPATVEGQPPPVDVYIDDGRHGEYQFLANHWSCTDIWNRRTVGDGGGVHEEPVVGQTSFAYVRIKNRGTQSATNILVKGFHCLPGVGLVYPTDWLPMTTPSLTAPNLAAADGVGEVVGPFHWTPSQVGHECMFFSVSAQGDPSNIDGAVPGAIQEWRLVPNDNNVAQRNVHPVPMALADIKWDGLPFWIRNHNKKSVALDAVVTTPAWLTELGWKFEVPALSEHRVVVEPGERRKVAIAPVGKGREIPAKLLEKHKTDRDIVVTVLHDGVAVGGMNFRLTPKAGLA